jgi:DNA mismatch repair ATPase MutS
MKPFLLYPDSDLETKFQSPWNSQELIEDLELETLFSAMSNRDKFISGVVKAVILSCVPNPPSIIRYRQKILEDCLNNPSIIKEIYAITIEAIENEKKIYWGIFGRYPISILGRSVEVMQMYMGELKRLREIAEEYAGQFKSEGFRNFFNLLTQELNDAYLEAVRDHLRDLKFPDGMLISAELGKGNKGANYILRKVAKKNHNWLGWIFSTKPVSYSYTIADRDEAGARALTELKERGINEVANALAQSCDHILNFFKLLQTELAFYIGCLNLREQLDQLGEPTTFPIPAEANERVQVFRELYDVCLALTMKQKVVGNDLHAEQKDLFIVTGANQGGKSTFLRSIGLAQLMMQSGMFVTAQSFRANVCDGLFTHFKREEDASMSSGKFDEELSRMNDIVNHITSNPMILFNESFAATNEREGSEIARQITQALLESRVKIFYVSHMYDFTHGLFEKNTGKGIFLRAERKEDGERTFRLVEGEPLQTSYGKDIYLQLSCPPQVKRA